MEDEEITGLLATFLRKKSTFGKDCDGGCCKRESIHQMLLKRLRKTLWRTIVT